MADNRSEFGDDGNAIAPADNASDISVQPRKEGMAQSDLDKNLYHAEIPTSGESLQPRKEDLADVEPGQPARKDDSKGLAGKETSDKQKR
jgi:hypothetical protein